jgi:CHAD domain-containing protein
MKQDHISMMVSAEQFQMILKEKLIAFTRAYDAYFESPYDEVIHDIRVSSRRLCEPLSVLEKFVDIPDLKKLIRSLKQIRKCLSSYRDLEVMYLHIRENFRCKNGDEQHSYSLVSTHFESLLEKEKRQIEEKLRKFDIEKVKVRLDSIFEYLIRQKSDADSKMPSHLTKALKSSIKNREKQVKKYSLNLNEQSGPVAFHHLRIAVKRIRYILEFCHDTGIADFKKQVAYYAARQQQLGYLCDLDVLENTLISFGFSDIWPNNENNPAGYLLKHVKSMKKHRKTMMKKAAKKQYSDVFIFL